MRTVVRPRRRLSQRLDNRGGLQQGGTRGGTWCWFFTVLAVLAMKTHKHEHGDDGVEKRC